MRIITSPASAMVVITNGSDRTSSIPTSKCNFVYSHERTVIQNQS